MTQKSDDVVISANGTEVRVPLELWREFRNIAGRLIDNGDIDSDNWRALKELSGDLYLQLPPRPRRPPQGPR